MFLKRIAAAIAGLCLICGTAHAAPEAAQTPEASGATSDGVIIFELAPVQGGPASPEEMAAMQLLLLQLLMMQPEMQSGGETLIVPRQTTTGVGI
jgi:hypothetical protein